MTKFSLSVRIAEGFLSKEIPILDLVEVVRIARNNGYDALCMRASQVGVHSKPDVIIQAADLLRQSGLETSMVTGDFDIVYNNDRAPDALRAIGPYLDLAQSLGATMIRVAIKSSEDIPWAQKAADLAAAQGLRLVHQCHTLSMFETVEAIEDTLRKIDRPNFGLIYEPANLEICGQDYGPATIRRLGPWIFNVYLQNQVLQSDGAVTLDTWCRGPVSFNIIPIHQNGGINFKAVLDGLADINYQGFVTVHQSATEGESPVESAGRTHHFLTACVAR
jgi:sugar phosphate isomerase/epimerase